MSEARTTSGKQILITATVAILATVVGGLLLAAIQSSNKRKELTYVSAGPIPMLTAFSGEGAPKVFFKDEVFSNLFVYPFRIENSGNEPLKNVRVLYKFDTLSSTFRIVGMGRLDKESTQGIDRRIDQQQFIHVVEYPLLDSGDVDANYMITTEPPTFSIIARHEGLKTKRLEPGGRNAGPGFLTSFTLGAILTAFGLYFGNLLSGLRDRLRAKIKSKTVEVTSDKPQSIAVFERP